MYKIALIGNPNSGKTTLFNAFTGATAHVGNWPGVTVEKKTGTYKSKKTKINFDIVDLPGIYSLSPYTNEEVVSRDFLLKEKPDCILNIVDATNLERNLFLTTQLLEINLPIVVALNMLDELEALGTKIDTNILEEELGVPVVSISALKNKGLKNLASVIDKTMHTKREATSVINQPNIVDLIARVQTDLEDENKSENTLFNAIKLIEGDVICSAEEPAIAKKITESKENLSVDDADYEAIVIENRYDYITSHYTKAQHKKSIGTTLSRSDKIDKVLTHKWFGIPIFLVVLFAVFHVSFSANFLFIGGLIPDSWTSLAGVKFYEGLFGNGVDGIASPGMLFTNFVTMTIDWVFAWFGGLFETSPIWLNSLVNDGILAGIGGVLGFAPLVVSLLLCLSILENTGYMARVAFILDRIFRKFGLSGRSFIPMIMGFSCSVPAISNTRTLSTDSEKVVTIRVVPFFTCGAKIPILTSIGGAIVAYFKIGDAGLITFSMYVLGIAVAILTIILMKGTTQKGKNPPFVMELPTYRLPQFKSTMILMWEKFSGFVKRAFTIIALSSIIVWFLTSFNWAWQYIGSANVGDSIMANIGQFVQPLFTPLGFGSQLGEWGWVFIVAAVFGLVAKENVPAMFATFAAILPVAVGGGLDAFDGNIGSVAQMIANTSITVPGLIAYIVFNMTTIPCFAAVATAKAELTKKDYKNTIWFWLIVSYVVSSMVYTIGQWWWTSFIWVAIIVVCVFLVKFMNSKRAKGEDFNIKLLLKKRSK